MQFTLRQGFSAGPALVLWVLISALCAISGPFGTQEGLAPLPRLIYWSVVVGGSVLGSLLINKLPLHLRWQKIAIWTVFAVAISSGVYLFNVAFFGGEGRTGSFLYLTGIVGATVLVVHGLLWLALGVLPQTHKPDTAPEDVAARFQRRLPLEVRGPLVRIEAQDHYLNVITRRGSALILMRLGEAVDELALAGGLQTHRSHWVALQAVQSHRRVEGRDVLVMSDGAEVPVARARRKAAREAGLF